MDFHDGIAARTVYGESRGETSEGRLAVAHVIRNRLKTGRWGTTVAAVCLAPSQFSCWLSSDPNRRKMLELAEDDFALMYCAESWLASEHLPDPSLGATFYQVVGTGARWSIGQTPLVVIGKQEFYGGIA